MRRALAGAHHTQIIYIAVAVQVQVRDHVRRVVQDALEFLDRGRLRECGGHCLEVQHLRDILVQRINRSIIIRDVRCGHHVIPRIRHSSAVNRNRAHPVFHRHDPDRIAGRAQKCHAQQWKEYIKISFHN